MEAVSRIAELKKSVRVVEKMPMMQKAAHVMPLVHLLIQVLEQQQVDIEEMRMVLIGMQRRGHL